MHKMWTRNISEEGIKYLSVRVLYWIIHLLICLMSNNSMCVARIELRSILIKSHCMVILLLLYAFLAIISAKSASGDKILVVIDDENLKNSHSLFFQDLAGFEIFFFISLKF